MSRRVLLVDADVDALGALASALRARGLTVTNANGAFEAVEQAFKRKPDVVLAARAIDEDHALAGAFAAVPDLADTPILFLVDDGAPDALAPEEVLRNDVDLIVSRITEASPSRASKPTVMQEIRGDLQQAPLVDLLQLLAMNRRSGVLGITTPSGAGELRLAGGEVIDAVYGRLEGEKALYRLLGERDGHFAFSPGDPTSVRRIIAPTSRLLMEALRQVDEVRRRRAELAPYGEAFYLDDTAQDGLGAPPPSGALIRLALASEVGAAGEPAPPEGSPMAAPAPRAKKSMPPPPTLRAAEAITFAIRPEQLNDSTVPPAAPDNPTERAAVAEKVAAVLQMPHNLDELLDEIGAPDLLILEVVAELVASGKIRRVSLVELTTPFAAPEQLPVIRSLVTRLARPGFTPPPHLVFAASARRMAALSHAVRRIADAVVPAEPAPRAPLPRPLGVLRLGDGVELAIKGVPVDDLFAPLWPLALHGAAAVVRLNDAGGEALVAHCEAVELMLIDAESAIGALDPAAPDQIAALVRAALEMAAGV